MTPPGPFAFRDRGAPSGATTRGADHGPPAAAHQRRPALVRGAPGPRPAAPPGPGRSGGGVRPDRRARPRTPSSSTVAATCRTSAPCAACCAPPASTAPCSSSSPRAASPPSPRSGASTTSCSTPPDRPRSRPGCGWPRAAWPARRLDDAPEEIRNGDVAIDEASYTAKVGGRVLDLTYKEFELLKFLAQHPGRVFTRAQLLQEVWGYDYFGGTRTVDVHVRRLRAKLGAEHEAVDRHGAQRRLPVRRPAERRDAAARRRSTGRRRALDRPGRRAGRTARTRDHRDRDPAGAYGLRGHPLTHALVSARWSRGSRSPVGSTPTSSPASPCSSSAPPRPTAPARSPSTSRCTCATAATPPSATSWSTTGDVLAGYAHVDPTDAVAGSQRRARRRPRPSRAGRRPAPRRRRCWRVTPDGRLRLWAHGDHPGAAHLAESFGMTRTRALWQLRRSLFAPLPPADLPDRRHRADVPARPGRRGVGRAQRPCLRRPPGAGVVGPRGPAPTDGRGLVRPPGLLPGRARRRRRHPAGRLPLDQGPRRRATRTQPSTTSTTTRRRAPRPSPRPRHRLPTRTATRRSARSTSSASTPTERGNGLGRALTVAGLAHLRALGLPEVMLYVDADNSAALRLYEGLGLRALGQGRDVRHLAGRPQPQPRPRPRAGRPQPRSNGASGELRTDDAR